eukprot:1145809-Pelagomonas_calceolata.AAC.1
MSLLRIPCTVTDASLHHALENSPLTFCALRSKIIPKHITKQTYKHTTSGRDCAVPLGNRSKVRSQGVSSIRLQGRTSSNSDTGFQTHHCRTACRSGTHSIASCGLRHLVLSFTPSPSCGLRHRDADVSASGVGNLPSGVAAAAAAAAAECAAAPAGEG